MHIPFSSALHLLHEAVHGVIATQSLQLPGYPFATLLPFALDEAHRPVFLISRLAEHTKNLLADPRASLLVANTETPEAAQGPRLTLCGELRETDADDALIARYLRYQPAAQAFLALGDFSFFRLHPQRGRYIEGFGRMGWIEEAAWREAVSVPPALEADLLRDAASCPPAGIALLGVDAYGIDTRRDGRQARLRFDGAPVAPDQLVERIRSTLMSA